jgi:hypothetical protein
MAAELLYQDFMVVINDNISANRAKLMLPICLQP